MQVWENHATPIGLFFLCICIAGGIAYQQILKGSVMTKKVDTVIDKSTFQRLAGTDLDNLEEGMPSPRSPRTAKSAM